MHIESCEWNFPEPHRDHEITIAASNMQDPPSKGIEWLGKYSIGKPVIDVPSNHEWQTASTYIQ